MYRHLFELGPQEIKLPAGSHPKLRLITGCNQTGWHPTPKWHLFETLSFTRQCLRTSWWREQSCGACYGDAAHWPFHLHSLASHDTRQQAVQKNCSWEFPLLGITPKSSILMGFSSINHLLWGTPIHGNPLMGSAKRHLVVQICQILRQHQTQGIVILRWLG